VNIVGLSRDPFIRELAEVLGKNQIGINTAVLPDFSESLIEGYFRADLQVLVGNTGSQRLIDSVFSRLELPSLTLGAPFGFDSSEDFARAIVQAVSPEHEVILGESVTGARKRWDDLKKRAANHKVGLVINELDLEVLVDPSRFVRSLPLLSVLEEMGLNLDILLVCSQAHYARLSAQVASLLRRPGRCQIGHYVEEENFHSLLDRVSCVYSDLRFDARISRAGKLAISSTLFEVGFSGVLRTLERILRRCELSYPARYQRYFGNLATALERDVEDDLPLS
jgi:hypothetical protein